jgi:MinD-like ATPase involved in chromosome partitioning or flagellar assembly
LGVVSGKGGVGKTTFAANLGIALSQLGKKVVVIDCNVTTPHLAYYIGAENYSITLNDIFKGEVDIKFAPLHKNGLMFIPSSLNLNDLTKIDMAELKKYVSDLAAENYYDFIILDSAPGLGREATSVLRACEEVIFVTTPTVPNVMDITRCAEVATKIGQKKFLVALNMVRGKKFELGTKEAEALFNTPLLGVIPFDDEVMDSTAQGMPVLWYKPNCKASKGFMAIANNLAGTLQKQSIFSRISNRLKSFRK